MDAKSVASALTVSPAADVALSWNAAGTSLTVTPKSGWKPATYYTVTIGTAALDRSGSKLAAPARAIFTTRLPTGGRISASEAVVKGRVPTGTTFALTFDGPVDAQAVQASFHIDPAVEGTFETDRPGGRGRPRSRSSRLRRSRPTRPTRSRSAGRSRTPTGSRPRPSRRWRSGRRKGPSIVRFRPLTGTTGVARGAALSVRFTARMDRASTAAAFSAQVGTKKLKGTRRLGRGRHRARLPAGHGPAVRRHRGDDRRDDGDGSPRNPARTPRRRSPSASSRSPCRRRARRRGRPTSATAARSGPARGTPSRRTTCS